MTKISFAGRNSYKVYYFRSLAEKSIHGWNENFHFLGGKFIFHSTLAAPTTITRKMVRKAIKLQIKFLIRFNLKKYPERNNFLVKLENWKESNKKHNCFHNKFLFILFCS